MLFIVRILFNIILCSAYFFYFEDYEAIPEDFKWTVLLILFALCLSNVTKIFFDIDTTFLYSIFQIFY